MQWSDITRTFNFANSTIYSLSLTHTQNRKSKFKCDGVLEVLQHCQLHHIHILSRQWMQSSLEQSMHVGKTYGVGV
jgi:hypothetical protein